MYRTGSASLRLPLVPRRACNDLHRSSGWLLMFCVCLSCLPTELVPLIPRHLEPACSFRTGYSSRIQTCHSTPNFQAGNDSQIALPARDSYLHLRSEMFMLSIARRCAKLWHRVEYPAIPVIYTIWFFHVLSLTESTLEGFVRSSVCSVNDENLWEMK
jgi:hypothetical protein